MKTKFLLLFFILAEMLYSCSSLSYKPKIGILMRGFKIERCKTEKEAFVEQLSKLGADAIVLDADENDALQAKQGMELIDNGIDALILFAVNVTTSGSIIRYAHEKGVKVLVYESMVLNSDVDYFISADNFKAGSLMAEYLLKVVPKGNYAIIGGDKADRNAVLIKEGNYKVIKPEVQNGNIKILYDIYADWTSAEGYHEVKNVLSLSTEKPDVILTSNDGLAGGAIEALREFGLDGKIPVSGLDCDLSACQRIAQGTQLFTVYKSIKIQAETAAKMAYQMALGKIPDNINSSVFNGKKNVQSHLIEPMIVDKNNMEEIIIRNNVYTKNQVFEMN